MKYILIIFLMNSNGAWITKITQGPFETKVACQRAAESLRTEASKKVETACVTADHFNGKRVDSGVALD